MLNNTDNKHHSRRDLATETNTHTALTDCYAHPRQAQDLPPPPGPDTPPVSHRPKPSNKSLSLSPPPPPPSPSCLACGASSSSSPSCPTIRERKKSLNPHTRRLRVHQSMHANKTPCACLEHPPPPGTTKTLPPYATTKASRISTLTLIPPSPSSVATTLTDSRSLTTQSGPAAKTSSTVWLVTSPMTLHPAALPARIPAGASSSTRSCLSPARPRRSRPRR